jgi:hypothetical protein
VWVHGYAFNNEINYLFVAMARAAGLHASVVRLTDRRRAALDTTVLDASQLNATVVLVRMGDQNLYLDPATRFCPYGLVPWFETGVRGLELGRSAMLLLGFLGARPIQLSRAERRAPS